MNEKQLSSLIQLLDDPDQEVFQHVEAELVNMGMDVVQHLEAVWEHSFDALQQTRIENLIHKIQLQSVYQSLQIWKVSGGIDLLEGLMIINRYQYPDMDDDKIRQQIQALVSAAYLQLESGSEASDQVRLLNQVLYLEYGLSGNTSQYHDPQNSYIGQVLESRKGNPILLAAIYSIVAQELGIPIFGVNLPKHFILAYVQDGLPVRDREQILFYINAFNRGQIFGRQDVVSFLRQLELGLEDQYVLPCTNTAIVTRVLRNLASSYTQSGNIQKKSEIESLLSIMTDGTD